MIPNLKVVDKELSLTTIRPVCINAATSYLQLRENASMYIPKNIYKRKKFECGNTSNRTNLKIYIYIYS